MYEIYLNLDIYSFYIRKVYVIIIHQYNQGICKPFCHIKIRCF